MSSKFELPKLSRRSLLKATALAGVAQVASPFVVTSWAADDVKIGVDNPLTGTYAITGRNELHGMELAVQEINAHGGILGRQAKLIVEDSTSGDAGVAGVVVGDDGAADADADAAASLIAGVPVALVMDSAVVGSAGSADGRSHGVIASGSSRSACCTTISTASINDPTT